MPYTALKNTAFVVTMLSAVSMWLVAIADLFAYVYRSTPVLHAVVNAKEDWELKSERQVRVHSFSVVVAMVAQIVVETYFIGAGWATVHVFGSLVMFFVAMRLYFWAWENEELAALQTRLDNAVRKDEESIGV